VTGSELLSSGLRDQLEGPVSPSPDDGCSCIGECSAAPFPTNRVGRLSYENRRSDKHAAVRPALFDCIAASSHQSDPLLTRSSTSKYSKGILINAGAWLCVISIISLSLGAVTSQQSSRQALQVEERRFNMKCYRQHLYLIRSAQVQRFVSLRHPSNHVAG